MKNLQWKRGATLLLALFFFAGCTLPEGNSNTDGGTDPSDGGSQDAGIQTQPPWPSASLVSSEKSLLENTQLVSLPGGGAMIFWTTVTVDPATSSLVGSIKSRRFDKTTGSLGPEMEHYAPPNLVSGLQVRQSGTDSLLLIWKENLGMTKFNAIYSSQYTISNADFSAPALVASHNSGAGVFNALSFDANASGQAGATWTYNPTNVSDTEIWVSAYQSGVWSTADASLRGESPTITVSSAAELVVAFVADPSRPDELDGASFDLSGTLKVSKQGIGNSGFGSVSALPIPGGGASLLFSQLVSGSLEISLQQVVYSGGAFAPAAPVALPSASQAIPGLGWARDADGSVFALLGYQLINDKERYFSGKLGSGGNWTFNQPLPGLNPSALSIGAGSKDHSIAVWEERGRIFACRGVGETCEAAREVADSAGGGDITRTLATLDDQGRAYAAYLLNSGSSYELWANTLGSAE